MLEALQKLYEANIALAKANIQIYLDNPAGIGEHPDIVQAVDSQITLIAAAEEKLNVLIDHYDIDEVEEEDEEVEKETPEFEYINKNDLEVDVSCLE
tara:strand:+ start:3912 stop:4202 length:291 start_codon:yes stop_codon:yes gene_type:complete